MALRVSKRGDAQVTVFRCRNREAVVFAPQYCYQIGTLVSLGIVRELPGDASADDIGTLVIELLDLAMAEAPDRSSTGGWNTKDKETKRLVKKYPALNGANSVLFRRFEEIAVSASPKQKSWKLERNVQDTRYRNCSLVDAEMRVKHSNGALGLGNGILELFDE